MTFPSTCAASDDKSLIEIKVNGKPLTGFQPSVLTYQLQETFQNTPDVKGFSKNPLAKIVTTVSGTGSQQKLTLTVTAENGTNQVYEISFNLQTSSRTILLDDAIKVYNNGNTLIVSNKSPINAIYKVFNIAGQSILSGQIATNSQQLFSMKNAGVYFIQFNLAEMRINRKFVI